MYMSKFDVVYKEKLGLYSMKKRYVLEDNLPIRDKNFLLNLTERGFKK